MRPSTPPSASPHTTLLASAGGTLLQRTLASPRLARVSSPAGSVARFAACAALRPEPSASAGFAFVARGFTTGALRVKVPSSPPSVSRISSTNPCRVVRSLTLPISVALRAPRTLLTTNCTQARSVRPLSFSPTSLFFIAICLLRLLCCGTR